MKDRTILHSDINCCYVAIEHLHHPELADKPLAVGGDPEARHGIVLTADYIAKKHGVRQAWHSGRQSRYVRKSILFHREWTYIFGFPRWHMRFMESIPICRKLWN